jgi:5-methylthioadenosine/S-adenosylhomocysteine deaminase
VDRYIADQLITMAEADSKPIVDGAVDVEAGRIVWSGPVAEAPKHPDVATHHISGILMPGMVNTHAHSPMVLLRGMGEGLPVERWLREVMWPREAKVTDADVLAGMRMGAAELLLNGVTTSVEMYFRPQAVAEAANDIGLRCLVAAAVIDQEQLIEFGSWESQVEQVLELRERWTSSDLVDIAFGPHDPTLSERCLRHIAATANDAGMLVHIHLTENPADVAALKELTGTTGPAYLESIGMFEPSVLAAHAVWLSDEDIETLARNEVAVAHCPCSNTKHASGIARVEDMIKSGVRVSIATDGPASHHRMDLFEEMRTAIRLARVKSGDPQALLATRALRMVTAGAADTIGRPDLGRLVAGAAADMVAIDGSALALNPVLPDQDDVVSRIVWSGSPAAISAVWVAGEKLVDRGSMTRVDVSQLAVESLASAVRLAE